MSSVSDLPSIPELLRQARAGDREALESLLRRSREFVRLLVRRRKPAELKARVDSSDLIQETLLRAAQNLPEFRGQAEEEWRAWLVRIAEREVIHQRRLHLDAAKRSLRLEQPLNGDNSSDGAGPSRLEQWCSQVQSSPSQAALRKERALLLADTLARLPEDYREVLVLRHLEGLAFPEIAERLGRSAGAVRVLWTRALKKLREELVRTQPPDSGGPHG